MKKNRLFQSVLVALFGAIGFVLMFFEFSLIPGYEFLKFDFGDVPALLAGVFFGPVSSVVVELIKNFIHLLRTSTLGYGEIMNFTVGCAFVVPFSLIFRNVKTQRYDKKIVFSSIISIISIVTIGILGNAVITPLYYKHVLKWPIERLWETILYGVIPFNVIKGLILSIVSYPLVLALTKQYKKLFGK